MANYNFSPEMTPAERLQALHDNADHVEVGKYDRDLSKQELDDVREHLAADLVQLAKWKDELDAIKEAFKIKMKPLQENVAENVAIVRSGREQADGEQFHFRNEDGTVTLYDAEGQFIVNRRLRPEERQRTIMNVIPKNRRNDDE